jgi:hypothetical protein
MSSLITPGSDGLPGIDLPAEYRMLQDWSSALDERLENLKGILAQLTEWTGEAGEDPLMCEFIGILADAGAVEGEALAEAFTVVDVGFDVIYDLADTHGITPDDLDDQE